MSKVRINDLAREMEVKSRQILDILAELGLAAARPTPVRWKRTRPKRFARILSVDRGPRPRQLAASRAPQAITPKIDLSHISKPGDVLKAILAKKQEEEAEARQSHCRQRPLRRRPRPRTSPPVGRRRLSPSLPPAAPARPEPRKIVPQPRSAPPIVAPPPAARHCLRPPAGPGGRQGSGRRSAAQRPAVAVAPPAVSRGGQAARCDRQTEAAPRPLPPRRAKNRSSRSGAAVAAAAPAAIEPVAPLPQHRPPIEALRCRSGSR
jgi:translation initiation factor IF-2